jgi:hypothetical protein
MDISTFMAGMAATMLANALTLVYLYCLNAMAKSPSQHPPWGVILGGLAGPAVAALSIYMFVTA